MTQLENRTAVLARPETTYGVDSIAPNLASNPSPYITDALSCNTLDLKVNGSVLTRNNYSPSLSQDNIGMGRMLLTLTFKTELKTSGSLGVAPRIGRLIKACGFQETVIGASAAAGISDAAPGANNASTPAGVITSGLTGATNKTTPASQMFDTYRITVTTGGAPATAKFIVTGAGFPDNDTRTLNSLNHYVATNSAAGLAVITGTAVAPVLTLSGTWVAGEFIEFFAGGIRFYYQVQTSDTVTTIATALKTAMLADGRFTGTNNASGALTVALTAGTVNSGTGDFVSSAGAQAINLGNSGAVITIPVWTGNLVAGEYWEFTLLRPGVRYDPISAAVTSLTFYVYTDGSLFKMTGSRGTFSVDGAAATYPTCSWTFTGIYNDPIDAALPVSLSYENSKPYKVELTQLAIYGINQNACASKFSFDIGNTVEAKDCINAREGYDEVRITDRVPMAGADPQAEAPSVSNPWWRMRREDTTRFHAAVGRVGGTGNIVRIQADDANLKDVPFANRNKIRAFDYQMQLARTSALGDNECMLHFG